MMAMRKKSQAMMKDKDQNQPMHLIRTELSWEFSENKIRISEKVSGERRDEVRFFFPVAGQKKNGFERTKEGWKISGRKEKWNKERKNMVAKGPWEEEPESIFFLAGGLECWKLVQKPVEDGTLEGMIEIVQ